MSHVLDLHIWIVQVEHQGQTRYIRVLDHKPFINSYYSIGHRLKLKYFFLAQFLLNAYQAAY